MRILLTGPFPYRSIPNKFQDIFFLDSLIQSLIDNGHTLILLCSASDIKKDIDVNKGNVRLHVCKIGKHGNLRAAAGFKPEIHKLTSFIRKLDGEKRINVFHAHWCYEYASACLNVDPNRTVVSMHDWPDTVCPMFHNFYWNMRQKLGNRTIQSALHFTAVSPYIADKTACVSHKHDIPLIPNSINIDDMREKEQTVHSSLNLLAVNNGFIDLKNVVTTLKAFTLVCQRKRNISLTLCGCDYEPHGKAYQYCMDNHISCDNIIFRGSLAPNQLALEYQNADVLVHASKEESFGIVLIEAMKYGCAIIAGNSSGAVPWVLEHGKSGLLVNITSVEEVADAIETMMDTNTRLLYQANGYRRVKDFSTENIIEAYFRIYSRFI